MDDLLKRMLAVEQEANTLVAQANGEAKKLLAEARRQANEEAAQEQASSAREYNEILETAVKQAQAERAQLLDEADIVANVRAQRFRAVIQKRRETVVSALLGG